VRAPARPRLLVVNQYFASREATGQLLLELTAHLADEFDITVVTASSSALADSSTTPDARVRVRRVRAATFGRSSLILRALNYLTFLGRVPVAALRSGRADVILCLTDPPVVGLVALLVARLRRIPFVLGAQDLHPQLGQVSGHLTNPAVVVSLRIAQRLLLRTASRVVAIGEAMRERLVGLGASAHRTEVIPNWTDIHVIRPLERQTVWAREHALEKPFVVMHAGNIGQLQGLDMLVEAAEKAPEITFVVVGDGSSRAALVERAEHAGSDNLRFLPWQEHSRMAEVLSAADAHLVSLVPGLAGLLEPSKLYAALASGRPIITALDETSEGARVVTTERCGIVTRPNDADALVTAVRSFAALTEVDRVAMGQRARTYAERCGDRRHAAQAYARVLHSAIASP